MNHRELQNTNYVEEERDVLLGELKDRLRYIKYGFLDRGLLQDEEKLAELLYSLPVGEEMPEKRESRLRAMYCAGKLALDPELRESYFTSIHAEILNEEITPCTARDKERNFSEFFTRRAKTARWAMQTVAPGTEVHTRYKDFIHASLQEATIRPCDGRWWFEESDHGYAEVSAYYEKVHPRIEVAAVALGIAAGLSYEDSEFSEKLIQIYVLEGLDAVPPSFKGGLATAALEFMAATKHPEQAMQVFDYFIENIKYKDPLQSVRTLAIILEGGDVALSDKRRYANVMAEILDRALEESKAYTLIDDGYKAPIVKYSEMKAVFERARSELYFMAVVAKYYTTDAEELRILNTFNIRLRIDMDSSELIEATDIIADKWQKSTDIKYKNFLHNEARQTVNKVWDISKSRHWKYRKELQDWSKRVWLKFGHK